jgi:uncharacterized delta-60 repeat protein
MFKHNKTKLSIIIALTLLLTTIMVINVNADPTVDWIKIYSTNHEDKAFAISTDSNDNIIVAGYTKINTYERSIIVKYTPDGTRIFDKIDNTYSSSRLHDVTVDSQDNIIVVGKYYNTDLNYDFYIVKYDSNCNLIWSKTYDSGKNDIGYGITVDSDDNIIVTGESSNSYHTIKYDQFGTKLWEKTYSSYDENHAKSVSVDNLNNIIVTGYIINNNVKEWLTIKYNPQGLLLWEKNFNDAEVNIANDVTCTNDNSIIVVGTIFNNVNSDIQIIKYDQNGQKIWEKSYDHNIGDDAKGIEINSAGEILVTGSTYQTGQKKNYLLTKFDPNNNLIWFTTFDRGYNNDYSYDVAVDSENSIIITGFAKNTYDPYDILTIKYADTVFIDNEKPQIFNVNDQPDPQYSGGFVNISCEITDNVEISEAKVNIKDPDDASSTFPLAHNAKFYYNSSYTKVGIYEYFITAKDINNNEQTSPTYTFDILTLDNNDPYQPTDPHPPNEATGVDTDVKLYWTGGDPDLLDIVNYDIYLGKINPPPKIVENHVDEYYQPWTMDLNTLYYWQIVAKDNHGASTPGPIWSFTTTDTANDRPDIANDIEAPLTGDICISYQFNTSSTDVDGDNVKFGWDWNGDGVADEWSDWYSSGEKCTMQHTWSQPGVYNIQVICEDEHFAESIAWSNTFTITINNNKPGIPENPNPSNQETKVIINPELNWTCLETDICDSTNYDVYFDTNNPPTNLVSEKQSEKKFLPGPLEYNTKYYWKVISWDSFDESSEGNIWEFTTKTIEENIAPDKPSEPQPENNSADIDTNPYLSVYVYDEDLDELTVQFFNATDNSLIDTIVGQSDSRAEIQWNGLNNDATHYWYVVVNDSNIETKSDIWNFKTKAKNQGGTINVPTGSGPSGGFVDKTPIANINGPYSGLVGEEVQFDASSSNDKDEGGYIIKTFDWQFFEGDEWHNDLGAKPTHIYDSVGEYKAKLRVTDDEGSIDFDSTTVTISINQLIADAGGPYYAILGEEIEFDGSNSENLNGEITGYRWDFENDGVFDTDWLDSPTYIHTYENVGDYDVLLQIKDDEDLKSSDTSPVSISVLNYPPSNPLVNGANKGHVDTQYSYTAISDDPDDHKIRYIFDWDDDSLKTTSNYINNNEKLPASHIWDIAGIYKINVYAEDEMSMTSDVTEYMVCIDVDIEFIEGLLNGYLIDYDLDGIYDYFYNNKTGNESSVEEKDGKYLIDIDGDSNNDFIYDPETKTIEKDSDEDESKEGDDDTLYPILFWLFLILFIFFIIFYMKRRSKTEEKVKTSKSTKTKSTKSNIKN